MVLLGNGDGSDGDIREESYTVRGLVARGTVDAVCPHLQRSLPVPAPLTRVITHDRDPVELEGGRGE